MAKSFPEILLELATKDPRICGVSCDCWGFISPLGQKFPKRAIEIGIAEQNLIGVSAGLAMQGKIPFAIGMNPFVTMRCFEQIRTDLGYGERNVKVIGGYGGGIMYGGWGCTHHAMEEIGLMRLIPTMTVVMPADAYETEHATRAAAATEGPFYIALSGGTLPLDKDERSFEIGKAVLLREGNDVTIIGVGPTVGDTLKAGEILESKGISARILDMHTVKPIDKEAILQNQKHSQAKLYPSEVVTLALLYALKGCARSNRRLRLTGQRAFWRWLTRDYHKLFPHLPHPTRLFRLFNSHQNHVEAFLAEPSLISVIDTYGIELLHPIREGRSEKQIGKKGKSNHCWIVGGKLCFLLKSRRIIG